MNPLHRALRLFSASALLFASFAPAQSPTPRIRGPIEANPTVPLAGSLNPHLRTAEDLGPLAPETRIAGVTIVFSRSATQEADLQQILAQQTDPSSPLYRHWLTPDQFAARFGLAETDVDAAQSWLQSHGFTIDAVTRSRDRITFSGNAAEIQQAFGAELHRFRWNNELHFAPATELSLPASLAPVTAAVLHLSDFRPKPNVPTIHPDYTTISNQQHFLVPFDISTMYDLTSLYNRQVTGSGQQLAIVGQSYANSAPIGDFLSRASSSGSSAVNVIVPDSGVEAIFPGDEGESQIDLEYSQATASTAGVFFVFTGSSPNYNVTDALTYAINQDIAPVISISYTECESLLTSTDTQAMNATFEQAAAQGQTIVASSGDTGATGCAAFSGDGISASEQQALAVGFPASSPYVTAVGGTQMAPGTFAAGNTTYWLPAAGGIDAANSLLTYVPEVAWNEDSPNLGLLASGGGSSAIFARPSWQSGVAGIPAGSFRLVPDVALQASIASPGYAFCTDDPDMIGSGTSCTNGIQNSSGTYTISGGTSFSAPIFAGFLALLNENQGTFGLGNINPVLYSLASQPIVYDSAFHDITTGTTACVSGDGNCSTPGQSGYAATTGYDQATGLGSLDFNKLAQAWPAGTSSNLIPTSIGFFTTTNSIQPSSTLSIEITVITPIVVAPIATGTISLTLDGNLLEAALPIQALPANSGVTYSLAVPSTSGSHLLRAYYPGDATHTPSSATYAIVAGNVAATGSFTLAANNLTLSANSTGSTQVTVTPAGGYNGALAWSSGYTGGTVSQTICYLVNSPPINGPTTATFNIGVGTACSSPKALTIPSTVQRSSAQHTSWPLSQSIPSAAAFTLLIFGFRRRKLPTLLPVALLATISIALTGCGGGSSSGGGTQSQAYTVTLTAKDSVNTAITASTSFTLTVN